MQSLAIVMLGCQPGNSEYPYSTSWDCMTHPKTYSFLHLLRQSAIGIAISTAATLAILLGLTSLGVLTGSFPRTAPLIDGALSFVLVVASRLIISTFQPEREAQRHNRRSKRSKPTGAAGSAKALSSTASWAARWDCTCCGARFAFGTSSPVSGQIKRWWGSFPSRVYGGAARSPLSFFGIDPEGDFNAWTPITNLVGKWNSQIEMGSHSNQI